MVQTVNMVAQAANANITARSGTVYQSNASGLITGVVPGDIESLMNSGCAFTSQRAILTPTVSSYIVQGAINNVPVSSLANVYTLAAPTILGAKTTINSLSTASALVNSSGATILNEKGVACTVLTLGLGVADLEAVGSTLYQLSNRSLNTSSGGAVYGIASS